MEAQPSVRDYKTWAVRRRKGVCSERGSKMVKKIGIAIFCGLLLTSCDRDHDHSCEVSYSQYRALQDQVTALNRRTNRASGDFLAIRRFSIPLGKTASEVCDEHRGTCVGVTTTPSYDNRDRFCGHTAPSCNSRVSSRPRCMRDASGEVLNYVIDRAEFRRTPGAPGTCSVGITEMCLSTPSYDYAVCAVADQEILNPNSDAGRN